jgi:hypothetical protein
MRPMKQTLPWTIPDSVRPLDVVNPLGSTGQFTNIDPLTNNPTTVINQLTNFGWEYVWHCHLLGHEENDMMRPIVLRTSPINSPRNLAAGLLSNPLGISLSWTAYTQNPGNPATGLRILRRTDALATLTTIATITNNLTTTTSFVDRTVTFNTNYIYVMVAFNANGVSQTSNSVAISTPAPPPTRLATPTNLQAPAGLITKTAATLTWTRVTGALQYIIERSTNGGATWLAIGLSTTNSFRVTGLTTLTTYQFRVTATNGNVAQMSLPSAPVTLTTK